MQVKAPNRLVDYFCIVGPICNPECNVDENQLLSVSFKPAVKQRYPTADHLDARFPNEIQLVSFGSRMSEVERRV